MSICPGCGGVIGRDCFNPIECQQIAASMNNQAEQENEQLKSELGQLQAALNRKDEEIARLRKALGRIEQYSDSGSYATAIVEMKVIATEALKQ